MDLGLKEIITTIIVGAFTILGFEFVLFNLLKINITGIFLNPLLWINTKKSSSDFSPHLISLIVFIGISFGIGILAEDLSYKFVDNELPFNFESRNDTRISVIVEDFETPKIRPLGINLAKNNAFVLAENPYERFKWMKKYNLSKEKYQNSDGVRTQKWLLNPTPNPCGEKKHWLKELTNLFVGEEEKCFVNDSLINLYYAAKNNVYKNPNYYDEMKKIQLRSDYTRSIGFISLGLLVLTGLIVLIFGIRRLFLIINRKFLKKYSYISLMRKYKKLFRLNMKYRKFFSIRYKPIKFPKVFKLCIILLIMMFSGYWAYLRESREFNKRAFGYYDTMLTNAKLKQLTEEEKEDSNTSNETIIPNSK